MTNPEPPTNVRLVTTDGTEIPVDCHYDGYDPINARHIWTVIDTGINPATITGMRIDTLPAHTAIGFPMGDSNG